MVGTVKFETRIKELVENLPDLAVLVEPLLIVRRVLREQFGMPSVTGVQTTFHEDWDPERHAMPPGGFRLAIINCWDRAVGLAARERLLAFHLPTHVQSGSMRAASL